MFLILHLASLSDLQPVFGGLLLVNKALKQPTGFSLVAPPTFTFVSPHPTGGHLRAASPHTSNLPSLLHIYRHRRTTVFAARNGDCYGRRHDDVERSFSVTSTRGALSRSSTREPARLLCHPFFPVPDLALRVAEMQSVQRQFGKLMNKSPGDNAKVAAILHDYEDANKLLGQVLLAPTSTLHFHMPAPPLSIFPKLNPDLRDSQLTCQPTRQVIENTKTLRDSWVNLGTSQWAIVKEYEGLYDPIVGATEGHGRPSVTTPKQQLDRTFKLREAYSDLKDELIEEVVAIDVQVIRPATEARDFLQPIRKTIKKRENKRLDYEKAEDKVKKLQKKSGRTPKEDAALSKAEFEMQCASEVRLEVSQPPPPLAADDRHHRNSTSQIPTSEKFYRLSSTPRSP